MKLGRNKKQLLTVSPLFFLQPLSKHTQALVQVVCVGPFPNLNSRWQSEIMENIKYNTKLKFFIKIHKTYGCIRR